MEAVQLLARQPRAGAGYRARVHAQEALVPTVRRVGERPVGIRSGEKRVVGATRQVWQRRRLSRPVALPRDVLQGIL